MAVAVAGYNGMWGGDQDDQTQAPALSLSLSLSHVIRNHQHTSSDLRAYIHSSQQKKIQPNITDVLPEVDLYPTNSKVTAVKIR